MRRHYLTAILAALALPAALFATHPGGLDAGPVVADEPVPVPPPPSVPEEPTFESRGVLTNLERAVGASVKPRCDDGTDVVIAQELSESMRSTARFSEEELLGVLSTVPSRLPRDGRLGLVGFAQRSWSDGQGTVEPDSAPWVTLDDPVDNLVLPTDIEATLGRCANVALGLEVALRQLEQSPSRTRSLWLVVDGLHDCNAEGRFTYAALDRFGDRAEASGIDLSVLVIDGWSSRRGPTPLAGLVRGEGRLTRTPAWELQAGMDALASALPTARCPL